MNLDPTAVLQMSIGVAGIPQIQQFVQWLQDRWNLSTKLTPIIAVITGLILNVGLAYLLNYNIKVGVEYGLVAGFGAGVWHELTK